MEQGLPVATRTLRSPLLNLCRAPMRLGWLICPWIGTAPKPRLRSCRAILHPDPRAEPEQLQSRGEACLVRRHLRAG